MTTIAAKDNVIALTQKSLYKTLFDLYNRKRNDPVFFYLLKISFNPKEISINSSAILHFIPEFFIFVKRFTNRTTDGNTLTLQANKLIFHSSRFVFSIISLCCHIFFTKNDATLNC